VHFSLLNKIKLFRLKCTFGPLSFTNLRFWSPKFKNDTFGPLSFTPFANSWSLLILTQLKLTWRYFLMFFVDVDIIKNKLNLAMIIAIYNKRKKSIKQWEFERKNVENSKFHLIAIYIKNYFIIFGVGCVYILTMWRYQNWTCIIKHKMCLKGNNT